MNTLLPPSIVDLPLFFLPLESAQVAYRKVGHGEPLLLVHGYPLSGLTFRYLVPFLTDHFTCYIPDLPGLGETRWNERTDFSSTGQAQTLLAFADALGLSTYAILAHNTGGTIARKLALIASNRLTQLVMLGTEIPGHRPPWIPLFQRIANPSNTLLVQTLLRSRAFRRSSAGFGGCFTDLSRIDGEFYDLFVAPLIASKIRTSGQIHYLKGIDWNLVDAFKTEHAKITVPTLLIWGEDDPVFPVREASRMVEQLPNCKGFETVPKAKLFVHEENPEAVARIALAFFHAQR